MEADDPIAVREARGILDRLEESPAHAEATISSSAVLEALTAMVGSGVVASGRRWCLDVSYQGMNVRNVSLKEAEE